jgi:tRNA modification GTPase
MLDAEHTIVARGSPPGRGALALVRVSGPDALRVRDATLARRASGPWPAGRGVRVDLLDAEGVFDDGVAVWMPGPGTYTGEDSLEVTLHGNPLLVDRWIRAARAAGARTARPGEFTRRAVVHGKLDLVQAEATDQLIRARTMAGARLARAGLWGELHAFQEEAHGLLTGFAAELEARLDYPDDELALLDDSTWSERVLTLAARCERLAATVDVGRRRVDGVRVALVGPVNAGKSSLFNGLLGRARALVHDRAGTTRDVLEVAAVWDEVEVTLLDTAGERVTDDPVEAAGLALARDLVEGVDLVVVVLRGDADGVDAVEAQILERTEHRERLVVVNGVDRPGVRGARWPDGALHTSALQGEGIDALRAAIVAGVSGGDAGTGLQLVSERQADRWRAVAMACRAAVDDLPMAGPAAAAQGLTEALGALGELAGHDAREAVLDAVFSRFCIGK